MELDRHLQRDLPLWFQIKEKLRHAIETGGWAPGDQLPTEFELVEFFNVSRTTVRTALDRLADQGLVERAAGRGTFASHRTVNQPVNRLAGFHEDMVARGLVPSSRTLLVDERSGPREVSSALGSGDELLVFVERLLLADGQPMALQRGYLPRWVLGDYPLLLPSDLDAKSLYGLLEERTASYPEYAEQAIEATQADQDLAQLLDVTAGFALMKTTRLSFDRSRRPVEYVDVWYRADRYRFRVELARS